MASLDLSGQRILIVDDVAFARETLRKALFNLGNPQILEARDGLEAGKILNAEKKINFVIADFNMPRANGLELLKSIRLGNLKVAPSFPVALLTGYSEEHLVSMALALDVNAFIIKPVSKDSLSRRLKNMLAVTKDSSWLKEPKVYANTQIIEVEEDPKKPVARQSRKGFGDSASNGPGGGKAQQTGKFDSSDLAGYQEIGGGKFKASDLASNELIRRISAEAGGTEWSVAPELADSLEELCANVGGEGSHRLVSMLEELVDNGKLNMEEAKSLLISAELPELTQNGFVDPANNGSVSFEGGGEFFVALNEIPDNSILARNLVTTDGSVLMTVGTLLTPQVTNIIQHLDEINQIALELLPGENGDLKGLFVKPASAPEIDLSKAKQVEKKDLTEGAIIARDVYLKDGRCYATAGTQLTDRVINLLHDLEELGHHDRHIWVTH